MGLFLVTVVVVDSYISRYQCTNVRINLHSSSYIDSCQDITLQEFSKENVRLIEVYQIKSLELFSFKVCEQLMIVIVQWF